MNRNRRQNSLSGDSDSIPQGCLWELNQLFSKIDCILTIVHLTDIFSEKDLSLY